MYKLFVLQIQLKCHIICYCKYKTIMSPLRSISPTKHTTVTVPFHLSSSTKHKNRTDPFHSVPLGSSTKHTLSQIEHQLLTCHDQGKITLTKAPYRSIITMKLKLTGFSKHKKCHSKSISNGRTKIWRSIKVIARHFSIFSASGPTSLLQTPKNARTKSTQCKL